MKALRSEVILGVYGMPYGDGELQRPAEGSESSRGAQGAPAQVGRSAWRQLSGMQQLQPVGRPDHRTWHRSRRVHHVERKGGNSTVCNMKARHHLDGRQTR